MIDILLGLAIISVGWGVVSSIAITSYLSKKGHKINYLFLRVLILKYLHQYSKITKEETGKAGGWFWSYIVSMNLALLFALIGLIIKV